MEKRVFKILSLIIALFLTPIFITGCYDKNEVEDITYVTAIGLDKGKTNPIKMTLQYAVPKVLEGGGTSSSGGGMNQGSKPIDSITIECPTIYAGLNMMNGFLGKKLDLSHTKLVIFSEKFAREGISKYVYAITRKKEFRPNMYVVVSRCSAEKYIEAIQPIQEVDPVKYYELNYSAYKYTGFTADTNLYKFYYDMVCGFQSPTATLAGIGNKTSAKQFSLKDSTYKRKKRPHPYEGDYYAGNLPKISSISSEIFGLAAFNGDKLVGLFDGEESTDYLMVTGGFGYGNFTVTDPLNKNANIVIIMKQARTPKAKVNIENGKPKIYVSINTEGDFASIQSGINYESYPKLKVFENYVEKIFETEITQFLYRTKKFNVDICGFGSLVRKKFITWDEWEKYNWLSKYKNSEFKVEFKFRIRRNGLKVRSSPVKSAK